jgi:hypothetical protein
LNLSEYVQGSKSLTEVYSDIDYLNMLETAIEASKPWKMKRIIANDYSNSNVNHLLDFYDKEKTKTIKHSKMIIRSLFKQVLNEYVSEQYKIDYSMDLSITFGATSMIISVLTNSTTIEYSSWSNMIEAALSFDLEEWLNQDIFKFIYTMFSLQKGSNTISIKIGKSGGIVVYTRDKFALKIRRSFYDELKYLAKNSIGIRKKDLVKILEIYEQACN